MDEFTALRFSLEELPRQVPGDARAEVQELAGFAAMLLDEATEMLAVSSDELAPVPEDQLRDLVTGLLEVAAEFQEAFERLDVAVGRRSALYARLLDAALGALDAGLIAPLGEHRPSLGMARWAIGATAHLFPSWESAGLNACIRVALGVDEGADPLDRAAWLLDTVCLRDVAPSSSFRIMAAVEPLELGPGCALLMEASWRNLSIVTDHRGVALRIAELTDAQRRTAAALLEDWKGPVTELLDAAEAVTPAG